jgi:hypothetical protein
MSNQLTLLLIYISLLFGQSGFAISSENPFKIPFLPKQELTDEDFVEVQRLLKTINIHPTLHQNWKENECHHYSRFWRRCSRGLRQELINPGKGFYPKQELIKIGEGGDRCIVCCAPYRVLEEDPGTRARFLEGIAEALTKTGFHGYFLSLVGGFPNPTGKEICYAGIPYCFKIFMMLEAYKLGFNNVLWIDSACLPLHDPTPLFNEIQKKETLLYLNPPSPDFKKYIFENTRKLLKQMTGVNVLQTNCVATMVFGLKMDSEKVQQLIEEYYALVDMGLPFLSCYPEEFVLSALIGKPEFRHWTQSAYKNHLFFKAPPKIPDSDATIQNAKNAGYFFYQKKH